MNKIHSLESLDIRKIINILMIGYAFSVPISKATTNFFEIAILLLWLLDGNFLNKFKFYKYNYVIITLFVFIVYNLISLLWTQDIFFALKYIAKYRHFLLIPAFYIYFDKQYTRHIISGFLAGMFISELVSYGLFFDLFTYKGKTSHNPAPFMDHISYSVFLAFTSIILLNRIFYTKNFKEQILYILFFTTVTINLFLNGGRTGQIIFIILVTMLFFFNIKNKIKAFSITLGTLFIIFVSTYNFSPNFINRLHQADTEIQKMIYKHDYSGSFSNRVALWIIGIDQILDQKSLLGTGIGNDISQMQYYAEKNHIDYESIKQGDHHNAFITYTIQLGFIGLIILLSLFYFIFKLNIKDRYYRHLNILLITGFFIWSFTGMTFHGMNPMTLFAFFTALFTAMSKEEKVA